MNPAIFAAAVEGNSLQVWNLLQDREVGFPRVCEVDACRHAESGLDRAGQNRGGNHVRAVEREWAVAVRGDGERARAGGGDEGGAGGDPGRRVRDDESIGGGTGPGVE